MTIRNLLVLTIALMALSIIAWDYTCGHSLEDMVDPEFYCTICDAFQAALTGVILLYILILLGLIPVMQRLSPANVVDPPTLFDPSARSYRAPPSTI